MDESSLQRTLGRLRSQPLHAQRLAGLRFRCAQHDRHAVVAIPDSRKGEKLVLVTDRKNADVAALSEWAKSHGLPDLAVPKKILKIAELPVLGTGKTDYVSIQRLVDLDQAA